MIAIIDHGLGNSGSVINALDRLQIDHVLTVNHELIHNSSGIIIPGVGAFADGMEALKKFDLMNVLNNCVLKEGKPVLGICLGFQLMATLSKEFGIHQGLGWINSEVVKFNFDQNHSGLRIPHVGWNEFIHSKHNRLIDGIPEDALFYYTHSYHMVPEKLGDVLGYSEYGGKFVAAIASGNIYGTQFHPEKSQNWGLKVLENFAKIAC
jgi:glutamine amidotransferase